MARCFVTRELPGVAVERLIAEHEVEVWRGRLPPAARELRERTREAEGLGSLLTDRIDRELIAACPKLRVISNYAVGCDNVDLAAATERGIPVGHTPDVLTEATADFTLGLMLALARRVLEGDAAVRGGDWLTWRPDFLVGRDLHGATLGVVGLGRIGRAVARRAEGFGMKIVYSGSSEGDPESTPLERLLEQSDFVTLHVPLTRGTRGLIDEAALRAMKRTAYLVNTSRGPIVETLALVRALGEGWIAGAGLDVTDPEPLPSSHPLLEAPNLLVTPHIASASRAAREAMAGVAVDNLLAGLAGERMPHCANPEVYA